MSSLAALEAGEKEPTRNMLASMARVYHRSLLTLYLAEPPRKGDRGEDFRTVVPEQSLKDEASLDALVRDLRARQSVVRTVLEDDEDAQPLAWVGSMRAQSGVAALCEAMERLLGTRRGNFRAQRDAEAAFNLLRECAQRAGAFVLLAGNLGSHHSNIPVGVFRGFAIADPLAPFIVINDGDARAAWSFTLLHELAHLLLGTTGVSSSNAPDQQIERLCNDVAGEFLLPLEEARALDIPLVGIEAQVAAIARHADRLRVSRPLLAYRLYRAGALELQAWQEVSVELQVRWQAERRHEKERSKLSKSSGPSYYVVRRHRLGNAMLDFARRSMDAGTLSPARAAKALGVKPRSVYPLLAVA